ncbi:RNA-binding S4 domain-containing protein [Altererythrobacter sp. MF3-039]|uniref:RNA-binding S4 domain-containing protein n=1 Tax=Altererythrobacter sp. MF3-039 TaxID=3252901 RepID=UPI00390C8B63
MRIDRALYYLRFFKSRGLAQRMLGEGHSRLNGRRIDRCSQEVASGDVLTFPIGKGVRVIEILTLPNRRGPAAEAHSHYRALDPAAKSELAAGVTQEPEGEEGP